jgi:hypothetical protein
MVIVLPQMMLSIDLQFVGFVVACVQNIGIKFSKDHYIFMYAAFPDVCSINLDKFMLLQFLATLQSTKQNPKHFQ